MREDEEEGKWENRVGEMFASFCKVIREELSLKPEEEEKKDLCVWSTCELYFGAEE